MSQKLVRYQLIAFVLVTVLGIGYAMANYVGLGRVLGIGQYQVSVDLPSAGGLYASAVVTERGVTVGKVDGLHLTGHGVVADISIDNGTQIPSDLAAKVTNTSAVGEQYLELTPKAQGGPYLTAGAVIPASEVSLPPSPSTLLANLNALLKSVPQQQLTVTVNELYDAFNGTGPQLRQLLDSSGQLLDAARQNLSPTRKLIGQSQTVLNTQAGNAANIRAFSRNLAAFTTQLRDSNGDLTGSLDQAPGAITQLNDLIGQLQPTVPLLLDNLTATGQMLRIYLPNLRQFLVIFPADINDLTSEYLTSGIPGAFNNDIMLEGNNPAPCTTGYPSKSNYRQPDSTGDKAAPAKTPYCTVPHSSDQQIRGSHNYPCPNNPSLRSATASGCGLDFGTSGVPTGSSGSGATSAATYDPSNGLLVGPNGILYSVGEKSLSGNGPVTLQGLLRQTLGD
jgi:phospholipid/cholesterol/gamma-HCH transport system substrate-binding protein